MEAGKQIKWILYLLVWALLWLGGCRQTGEGPEVLPEPTPSAVVIPTASPSPESPVQIQTEPSMEAEPSPEPSAAEQLSPENDVLTCTISISCASILDHPQECDLDKWELVPEDGWILQPVTAVFSEGESVFDILQRVCREEKIHMEFSETPVYDSAYIEGIANLYEMDVGALSGWMYSVNGVFPNYGCSQYLVEENDVICWLYTCDLGRDVGGTA